MARVLSCQHATEDGTGGCDMRLDINTLTDIALPKHLMEALNVPCVYS